MVASGPSVANVNLVEARGIAKFMAINDSSKIVPWRPATKHGGGCGMVG